MKHIIITIVITVFVELVSVAQVEQLDTIAVREGRLVVNVSNFRCHRSRFVEEDGQGFNERLYVYMGDLGGKVYSHIPALYLNAGTRFSSFKENPDEVYETYTLSDRRIVKIKKDGYYFRYDVYEIGGTICYQSVGEELLPLFEQILDNVTILGQYTPAAISEVYDANNHSINAFIVENGLKDKFEGHAYCGCLFSPFDYLISKEGESYYEVYLGTRGKGIHNGKNFVREDRLLSSLFEWNNSPVFIYDIESPYKTQGPYYYFVLYDKNHNKKLEFDKTTMSAFKKSQKVRKYRRMLPFTKKQEQFITNLILMSHGYPIK